MSFLTRPLFNPRVLSSLLLYCPRQFTPPPNIILLLRITTITISIVAEDAFVEVGVTILTTTVIALITDLIFEVLIGLQTTTRGREIGNKTKGIVALHSGLMSSVNCAKP